MRHAEATRVRVDGETLSIEGTLPPETGGADARAYLVARRRGDVMEVFRPAAADGGRFSASLDLGELVVAHAASDVWDLRLAVDDRPLRLGTHLDDVPNRAAAVAFPSVRVSRDGAARDLEPYYTEKDNLSIRSEPAGTRAHAPASELAEDLERPRLARRLLGPVAVAVHRVALAVAARLAQRGRRPAGDGRDVRVVLLHAYGMGGTIRATISLVGALAEDRDVEVVSLVRRRERPFFEFPDGVKVTTVDDQRPGRGGRAPVARFMRRIPSVLVHPEDYAYPWCSLWTDRALYRRARCRAGSSSGRARPSTSSPPRSPGPARRRSPRSTCTSTLTARG